MRGALAQLAAAQPATASPAERTITGLAVPWGAVGTSEFGGISFPRGSIRFASPGRVKLLVQHDPDRPVGFATDLQDTEQGLVATFSVPESPEGDRALAEAANGVRDGLSVGVMLDPEVVTTLMDKLMNGDPTPTDAAGDLKEVSQVSIPAFDDARTHGSAAAAATPTLRMSIRFEQGDPMTTAPADSTAAPVDTPPAAQPEPVQLAAPTPNPFDAGFQVIAEPAVYTFDGNGPSFVRDMWRARFEGDTAAAERVQRFNLRWATREQVQMQAFLLTAAVETRPNTFIPQPYRPDMLISAIDKGRPLVSRIGTITLTDATPFRIPVEGDMTGGVGDHTEGTSHVAEGDSAVTDVTVTPGAISGAARVSRELVDASNPALDTIMLGQMMRNYRNATEAKVVTALNTADGTATASINTTIEVRQQIAAYYDTLFYDPTGIAGSPSWVSTLLSEVDTTGRAMLPSINPTNAVGTGQAGSTGASVDGVEIFKAWGVAATMAYLFSAPDVLIGESSIQTFRFEEVEGPGIIKLALWSYFCALVTRAGSVVKVTST